MEKRNKPMGDVRIEEREGGAKFFVGHAAVFYRDGDPKTEFRLNDSIVERINRNAFSRALKQGQDVRGLFNHNPDILLGRSTSGTMRIWEDEVGLAYEIQYNSNDPQHVSIMEKSKRGDLTGSSFAFRINGKSGQKWEKADG